jgi:hypothetical protein
LVIRANTFELGEQIIKNLRAILWITCLVTVGALGFALKSRAGVVTSVFIPISGTVFNPCNGENVAFVGVDHFTARLTISRNGGFHVDTHDNIHVTATDDQGNTYLGNQEDNSEANGFVGVEQTAPFIFSEITKGSAANFEVHALFHITVLANGTITAFVNTFTAACRG